MKKVINSPDDFAREAIEGLALAYPQYIRQIPGLQVVLRKDAPVAGKVTILTGGGSGHDPMFSGYVGRGMADVSVAGNVFASPPPPPIYQAAKAAHGGAGVLFLYGNYSGDILNFDMAAEMLEQEQIAVKTVRVADDVASAPPELLHERRGIAGDLFVIKVAGARAEEGATLAEVAAAAEKAVHCTRSMGVALSSCVIPASGRPIFEIGEQEMEIGMGLHGEPGIQRGLLKPADQIVSEMVARILADSPMKVGDEVAVLVNGFGATPLGELLIVFRGVARCLRESGVKIWHSLIGNYAGSLDMAGFSISLMRLDADLKRWLAAPAETPAFIQTSGIG
jgi:phosphoenolpyruvate---glycerone phosphotransferase subunit DhaK